MRPHVDERDFPPEVLDILEVHDIDLEDVNIFLEIYGSDGATGVTDWYHPAAYLHDYLYRTARVPRSVADEVFYITLREVAKNEDVAVWRLWRRFRAIMDYTGVRTFGWLFYNGAERNKGENT